ncbi:hypothetical protein BHE74_00051603 [Ensete ventricosum]|nr:hypothetical protein BHE74_00051603 [Ensete ventricosum]
MLAALSFLGTWPAVLTLLEQRGRLPQHTYLDYSITNLLAAVIIALTLGQIGDSTPEMPNFITQLGTTLNYFLDDRINRAEILFPGVACFLVAVCLGSAVHSSNAADNAKKLSGSSRNYTSKTWYSLSIVFFAGICFSLFSPAFNLATNDQWHTLKQGVPHLVVYTAFFYFSISCFIVGIGLNIYFLYKPVLGLPRSSFTAYLKDWKGRHWALLAGLLCGFGNGFQFMGGQAAGYAAADAVQVSVL